MKNPPHHGVAAALEVTPDALSELVDGKGGITPAVAVRLAKVFGGGEESWLARQARYDFAVQRRK